MKNVVGFIVCAIFALFTFAGCGSTCAGTEPALQIRNPFAVASLAPQNALPKGNVAVFSGPVTPEAAPGFGASACPVPAPAPSPLFGRAQLGK